jgi:hypothetical protein
MGLTKYCSIVNSEMFGLITAGSPGGYINDLVPGIPLWLEYITELDALAPKAVGAYAKTSAKTSAVTVLFILQNILLAIMSLSSPNPWMDYTV